VKILSEQSRAVFSMAARSVSRRHKRIASSVSNNIKKNVDILTGGSWIGVYEDSLYDVPAKGGLWDYRMPPEDISISFKSRGKGDSAFTADRVIFYDGKDHPETFIGSVSPEGRVILNSMTDTDFLIGEINRKAGTLSLLFYDDGNSDSSFGSQTAVGTYVFAKV
jgi:hypothetical protein